MIFPVLVLVQESVHEIEPYTTSGHVMETLNYPDKYRYQACVGNFTCPLREYWCRKCSFSSSDNVVLNMEFYHVKVMEINA